MFFFDDKYSDAAENKSVSLKLEETSKFLAQKSEDLLKENPSDNEALPIEKVEGEANISVLNNKEPNSGSDSKEEIKKPNNTKPKKKTEAKLESKREGFRKRTRKSRDRKKIYIEELEERVKGLEMENFRLHHLLLIYRRESWNSVSEESGSLLGEIEKHRKKLEDTFVDPKTGQYNERATNIK